MRLFRRNAKDEATPRPVEGWRIPLRALPNCHECPKPELDHSSYEAVALYNYCVNQQLFNDWSGQRLGLRMEAVVACLDELSRQGKIRDRETAFHRIWMIDEVVNTGWNAANAPKNQDSAE